MNDSGKRRTNRYDCYKTLQPNQFNNWWDTSFQFQSVLLIQNNFYLIKFLFYKKKQKSCHFHVVFEKKWLNSLFFMSLHVFVFVQEKILLFQTIWLLPLLNLLWQSISISNKIALIRTDLRINFHLLIESCICDVYNNCS